MVPNPCRFVLFSPFLALVLFLDYPTFAQFRIVGMELGGRVLVVEL